MNKTAPRTRRQGFAGLVLCTLTAGCGNGTGEPDRDPATTHQEDAPGVPPVAAGDVATPDLDRLPDVVVVMIDTLRPDHLDLYGYERETAPYLRRLGERSAVFLNAFSTSSWTAPATASLFTGLYPTRHGIVEGLRANRRRDREERRAQRRERKQSGDAAGDPVDTVELNQMPSGLGTLPELMQERGYTTFGIATNVNIDRPMGFHRGFDHFDSTEKTYAPEVFDKVRAWEDDLLAARPSFLYLHYMDVHVPYHERKPWYEKGHDRVSDARARYDSEIRFLDEHLAELHQRLGWDDAVLIVLSDHGEEFMEHGEIGHHFSLHSEVNRILLLFHAPHLGVVPRRIERNVSLIDVLPTLLDLLGDPGPGLRDGMTLWPLMSAEVPPRTDDFFAERTLFAHRLDRETGEPRQLWSAMRGHWRLIENEDGGEPRLYRMDRDPDEQNNLAENRPAVVERMHEQLAPIREEGIRAGAETVTIELDERMLEVLEELGYVGGGEE